MPATVELVRTFLFGDKPPPADEAALELAVDAANAVVRILRPDVTTANAGGDPIAYLTGDEPDWPANVVYAAVMYAAQLYGRRGSLFGVLNFQEMAVNMRTVDPHVYALLELGLNQRSVVA